MKKCPYCNEDIQETAMKCRFCGEWLNKTPQANQPTQQAILGNVVSNGLSKTAGVGKKIVAIFIALVVFSIVFFIAKAIVALIVGIVLSVFGIHISESVNAYEDVEAIANIVGFIAGVYFAVKTYGKFTKNK